MFRFFAASLLLIFGTANAAQPDPRPLDECHSQAVFGFPTFVKQDVITICREGYLTVHNNAAKIPLYSAYVLSPSRATGCSSRDSSFEVDRSLPPLVRAGNKDYARSGFDIGHQVSAEDLKFSVEAQEGAALLSNAAPQLPEFNRGIWKKLEDTVRGWAISRNHDLQIYVAPVVDLKSDARIGKGRVLVPHAFVKIIVDTVTSEVQVFLMKHEESKADLSTFIVSLTEAQKATGIAFPMPPKPVFGPWKIELKSNQKAKAAVCVVQ